jgi:adenylate kinase
MNSKVYVFLVGLPGCGKGTQAGLLECENGFIKASMSRILDEAGELKKGSSQLVSDATVIRCLAGFLNLFEGDRLLFDGFPRTISQAEFALSLKSASVSLRFIVYELSDETALARIEQRLKIEGREDDTPALAADRIRVYYEETNPVIQFLASRSPDEVRVISGEGTVEEVRERILSAIDLVPATT